MTRVLSPHRVPFVVPSQLDVHWVIAALDRLAKRAFDVVAAAIGLILLTPFFLMIGWLIKRDSAGPVFYRGLRAGRIGRNFRMLKFRTMRESPESDNGTKVTAHDDPRVTTVGRWLRNTKLNELPQLWNVLKGEMSLVGPRPEDPDIVAKWPDDARREILSVRPGITSPSSVLYRNEEAMLSANKAMPVYMESILPSKLRFDQLYVRHRSFMLDLDVIAWTGLALLPLLRAHDLPEGLLFFGPFRRIARRYLNWFVVDSIITLGSIATIGILWRLAGPLDLGPIPSIALALEFSLFFGLAGIALGIYRTFWSLASSGDAFTLFAAATVAGASTLLLNEWIQGLPSLPPLALVCASILTFVGLVLVRYRSRLLNGLARGWVQRKGSAAVVAEQVLIIGGGYAGQLIAWLLSNGPNAGVFHIVGFVDDDLFKQGNRLGGVTVLGRPIDIPQLVQKHRVDLIIFAINRIAPGERERILEICRSTSARVVVPPDVAGAVNGLLEKEGCAFVSPPPSGEFASGALGSPGTLFVPGMPTAQVQRSEEVGANSE